MRGLGLYLLLRLGGFMTGPGGGVGRLYGGAGWLYGGVWRLYCGVGRLYNGGVLVQCAVVILLTYQTVDELLECRVGEERCKHKQKEHRFDGDTTPWMVERRPDFSNHHHRS